MGDSTKIIRVATVPLSLDKLLEGQLAYMQQHFEVLAVSSPGELLQKVEQREGVRIHSIPMTRKITPFSDLKAIWYCYRLFIKERPTIVHSHTPKAGLIGMLAARLAGVPIRIHTVAGLPLMEARGFKRWLLEKVEKWMYACATDVWPNSKGLEQFILGKRYTSASKIKVIGQGSSNGIDISYFDPEHYSAKERLEFREELGFALTDVVFVFVGRLVKDKGIAELVESFVLLNSEQPHTKLLLVGPFEQDLDPLDADTFKQINSHHGIVHAGYCEDVRPYLAVADVLAFPSYREGFPNVVMQAGAMGLPAIVSDINGCNEIIVENKNGLIVPPKDSKALLKAMQRLIDDSALRLDIAASAREMISSRYDRATVWRALLDEYRRLLHNLS